MKPNTKLTVAQFRRFFTPWRYAPKRMIWDGRYVSIQPVTPKGTTTGAATSTGTRAVPRPPRPPRPLPRRCPDGSERRWSTSLRGDHGGATRPHSMPAAPVPSRRLGAFLASARPRRSRRSASGSPSRGSRRASGPCCGPPPMVERGLDDLVARRRSSPIRRRIGRRRGSSIVTSSLSRARGRAPARSRRGSSATRR